MNTSANFTVHDRLIGFGGDPVGGTPEQFDRFIAGEATRWAGVIKKDDIRLA